MQLSFRLQKAWTELGLLLRLLYMFSETLGSVVCLSL